MSRCKIYLDESGDLGFTFGAPYRAGGSSRHLTLGAAICAEDSDKHVKRFIKNFYRSRHISAGTELKWADLSPGDRMDFAQRAVKLQQAHVEISYATITVYKQKVRPHIRSDANKLYNYMTGIALLPIMRRFDAVHLVPDARSIRVVSGHSLHDYLQTMLWFIHDVSTHLTTTPTDSTCSRPLHFTDYLCGAFQSFYEDAATGANGVLAPITTSHRLFFP